MRNNREIMMRILKRRVRPVMQIIAEERFLAAKEWLLGAVRDHPISQDIRSHSPSSRLGSRTGTLYGFIGFEESSQDDPVADLLEFLDDTINFYPEKTPRGKYSLFSSSITYPTKSSFSTEKLKVKWSGRGWPVMIEEGISGLPYYINKSSSRSRSGEGIQIDQEARPNDFVAEQYLSPLLAEFRQRLLLKNI